MRAAALAPIVALIGACGPQELSFPQAQAEADAGPEAATGHSSSAPSPCTSDSDCVLSSLHCNLPSGVCVECDVPGDCPGLDVCEPTTHRCVPSCADGGVCPGDFLCDQHTGWMCVECQTDADCAGDPQASHCDGDIGQCVQCITASQCPPQAPVCALATCVEVRDYTQDAGPTTPQDGGNHLPL